MDIVNGTPEQMFMIMLKERIDDLENKVSYLTSELEKQKENEQKSYFFVLHISFKHDDDVESDGDNEPPPELKDKYINQIFRNRHVYEPNFAAWSVYNDSVFIALALREPLSITDMKHMIENDKCKIEKFSMFDYGLFKMLFYENSEYLNTDNRDEAMFYPHEDSNTEYWWRGDGATDVETDLDISPVMTTETFTESYNYGKSETFQKHLKKLIYKEHAWTKLLKYDHMVL
jgi:hypothetical protein